MAQEEALKKKRYAMESLKVDGEILGSGFFQNSSLLSTCPSFKTFIENLPNVGLSKKNDFPLPCFDAVRLIRAYIIELLQTEERSYLWYKDGARPFFENVLSPKVESCLKKFSDLSQQYLGEAFERNRGSEINVYAIIYNPGLLEGPTKLLKAEIDALKKGLFAMPGKPGGMPRIFDDAIEKKVYNLDEDGIEVVDLL